MNKYAEEHGLHPIGEYSYAGIDANYYKRFITYFDRAFNFTKTEAMIIRALIAAYPYPVPVRLLLKYAFKASRSPEPSSVRTHISIINKKLVSAGEELAIRMIAGEGYKFDFPHVKHEEISEENTARYKLR
jgi:DNA-binding winged helix-turn-helix (wHTH) protein